MALRLALPKRQRKLATWAEIKNPPAQALPPKQGEGLGWVGLGRAWFGLVWFGFRAGLGLPPSPPVLRAGLA